ncbi:hypothetical protein DCS_00887 [Drechmeria coniospora]|uniref:Uncharacterized protein n=1 Tax=Drechmeria coniospora TaxID=98403 RepID=A0A151GRN6_DRECN|nr:hypothetical protein DCS_00887 [Drechmeria coniospora]KYK59753.1 hypothetical protein DCS_00887 [Drechmeria coniospora]
MPSVQVHACGDLWRTGTRWVRAMECHPAAVPRSWCSSLQAVRLGGKRQTADGTWIAISLSRVSSPQARPEPAKIPSGHFGRAEQWRRRALSPYPLPGHTAVAGLDRDERARRAPAPRRTKQTGQQTDAGRGRLSCRARAASRGLKVGMCSEGKNEK